LISAIENLIFPNDSSQQDLFVSRHNPRHPLRTPSASV
jgi:hypothetical protein